MPRPKLEDDSRRRRPILIRLTGPESRAVRAASERRKMRPSAFVRAVAIAAATTPADPTDPDAEEPRPLATDPAAVALRREIRRLGSNLNQCVKLARMRRDSNLQSAVERLCAAVEKAAAP